VKPRRTVRRQIADVLKAHAALDDEQVRERTIAILKEVGFLVPSRILRAYPHQLSGGQRQRVAIAQALVCRPGIVVADEPLSSLDAATQQDIVDLLQKLKSKRNLAIVFITHNAGVLWPLADLMVILRDGQVLTSGTPQELRNNPDRYIQGILIPREKRK